MAVVFAPPVFAQDAGQPPEKTQATEPVMAYDPGSGKGPVAALCAKEIETLCAQFPTGPATRNCLETRAQKLSETCRITVESTGSDRGPGTGPVAHLCASEIGQFCAEVEHVRGRVRSCLAEHESELGAACTTALNTTLSGRWR